MRELGTFMSEIMDNRHGFRFIHVDGWGKSQLTEVPALRADEVLVRVRVLLPNREHELAVCETDQEVWDSYAIPAPKCEQHWYAVTAEALAAIIAEITTETADSSPA